MRMKSRDDTELGGWELKEGMIWDGWNEHLKVGMNKSTRGTRNEK